MRIAPKNIDSQPEGSSAPQPSGLTDRLQAAATQIALQLAATHALVLQQISFVEGLRVGQSRSPQSQQGAGSTLQARQSLRSIAAKLRRAQTIAVSLAVQEMQESRKML